MRNPMPCAAALLTLTLVGGCAMPGSSVARVGEGVPHTDRPFLDDPDNFQFVVVGDRTGGHRPGVFTRAMAQINLLQPEFVVSVGDLIEGYTDDPDVLAAEWDELDAAVNTLQMPFFYTAGNHDMSNNAMRELWHRRRGRDYYHFIYKDVLFLSLNTEDPPVELSAEALAGQKRLEDMMLRDPAGTQALLLERSRERGSPPPLPGRVNISATQLAYVERTLSAHRDARWTILLMHKPAWRGNNDAFARIERLLGDRDYTMIAGHEHYYHYTRQRGRDHVAVGTAGGIWLRDGPGRVDHVAWVTMTETGPVFANIALDGLFDVGGPDSSP